MNPAKFQKAINKDLGKVFAPNRVDQLKRTFQQGKLMGKHTDDVEPAQAAAFIQCLAVSVSAGLRDWMPNMADFINEQKSNPVSGLHVLTRLFMSDQEELNHLDHFIISSATGEVTAIFKPMEKGGQPLRIVGAGIELPEAQNVVTLHVFSGQWVQEFAKALNANKKVHA